jgi:hypothetical protein
MACKWWFLSKKQFSPKIINQNSTLLDDLSNDLLLEIFDYLSFNDILRSFGNLNIRFNKLIEDYPHCINLQFDHESPDHIRSLKLTASYQLSLLFSFQHSQLSSLRAIRLSNLTSLEYIYLGVCSFDQLANTIKMRSSIQTQVLTLSQYRLRRCHFKDKLSVVIDELPETLFALEYLQVVACHDFYMLSELLSRTPNLKSLDVSTMEIVQKPLFSLVCHITYLSLRPHMQCSVEELTTFFRQCCPYLSKLIVQLYIYQRELPRLLVNKHQWMTIFPSRLTFFHLKSRPNASLHLFKTKVDRPEIPLREKLCLQFTDIQRSFCQVIIDAPLTAAWRRNDTF